MNCLDSLSLPLPTLSQQIFLTQLTPHTTLAWPCPLKVDFLLNFGRFLSLILLLLILANSFQQQS